MRKLLALGGLLMMPALGWACPSLLDHSLTTLKGEKVNLCQFEGQVVMVVNTASYCGYTPQYKALEALYEKYKSQGFVVVGFPANDFGEQEPGSNQEVADFCERTYHVKFPMMGKSSVTPQGNNAVVKGLAQKTGEWPEWNFHKYLIDRSGQQVVSYPSRQNPAERSVTEQIEKWLKDSAK